MTSRYSVIQYLPSSIADERINVGVVAWDETEICSRFLRSWKRVRSFSGSSPIFLEKFSKRFQTLSSRQLRLALGDSGMLDQRRLEGMIGNWENGIQFTSPRGSLSNAKALLIEVAPMFLKDEKAKMTIAKPRNRRTAARIAATLILEAMERQVPDKAQELVAKNKVLSGQLENHTFDVVLANGKPFAAVHALSFEVDRSANLDRDVESTAWLLEDVRKKHRDMPMAVFLLPPIGVSAPYERAKKLFPKLNGEIVLEQKMPQWARKQAKAFAEHLG